MKQAVKSGTSLLLLLSLLISQSGCTYMLWSSDDFEAYRKPAPNPELHLYESKKQDDFLVVYKEQSERNDSIHTRAYWLNLNQNRLERKRAPIFTSKDSVHNLPSIPVFYFTGSPAHTNQAFYAICETNDESFMLYATNNTIGSYSLPVYNDGRGRLEKIVLTPITVSIDVAAGVVILGVLVILNANPDDFQPTFSTHHDHDHDHDNGAYHSNEADHSKPK